MATKHPLIYYVALTSKKTPSILSLSRQNLPNLEGSTIEKAVRGGYVLHKEDNEDLTIVGSGSEVCIAYEAPSKLKAESIKTQVVSLPCWLTFDQQDEECLEEWGTDSLAGGSIHESPLYHDHDFGFSDKNSQDTWMAKVQS